MQGGESIAPNGVRYRFPFSNVTFSGLPALYKVWSRLAPVTQSEKEIVMKNIAAIALFIVAVFTVAGPVSAQERMVKATVPFNFTVGDQTLPAGTYTMGSTAPNPDLVAIRNWDKKINVLSLGLPNSSTRAYDSKLVFHKYGNQYFLREIRSEGTSINIYFPTTKAEKRAREQVQEAGLFVDDPVLIALN
jgi:hypothetical protein